MRIQKSAKVLILLLVTLVISLQSSLGFSPSISTLFESEEGELIQSDLDFLSTLTEVKEADPEFQLIFEFQEMTAQNLKSWLRKRVSYLIPKDREGHVSILKVSRDVDILYPDPNISPIPTDSLYTLMDQFQTVQMENLGAGIYLHGKRKRRLIKVDLSHHFPDRKLEDLKILSPRVGLIEINQDILYREVSKEKVLDPYPASRVIRLSNLFHEGRHSDGHGDSLGFFHSVCPNDSDYAGLEACDQFNNGAYSIGALFLKAAHKACVSCSEGDKELLKLIYLDSRSRISNRESLSSQSIEEINNLTNQLNLTYQEFYSDFSGSSDEKLNSLQVKIEKLNKKINLLKNPAAKPITYGNTEPEFLMLR